MSELTVELFDSNHSSENLYTRTTNIPDSHSDATDTSSIQSETSTEDIETGENISFHEIFSQYITQTASFPPGMQEPNNPKLNPDTIGIHHEKNLFAVNEQVLNSVHSTDILHQNPLTNLIYSPQVENSNIEENTDVLADNLFASNTGNQNSLKSSFIPLSQEESGKNTKGVRETDLTQSKEFTNINNQNPLFPGERPFTENLVPESIIPETENRELCPQKNLNSLQDPHKTLNSPTNYHITTEKDKNLLELHFSHRGLKEIPDVNMKELPWTFKMMAQELSNENNRNAPIFAGNNTPNAIEENKEKGISGIQGDISSSHNIFNTSETNNQQDLFENSDQRQDISDFMSSDTSIQKTGKESSFIIDTQKTLDNIQSDTVGPQFNLSLDNRTTSLSESYKSNMGYSSHGTSITGMEDMHMNIMEQIFQKIQLVTHGDKSEIKLHLNPPDLGSVKIHFIEEHDEIEAKIFVDNAEVKAAIEHNSHHLKESIAANGVEIHKLEVYIQDDDENKRKSFENFNPGNPQQQNDSRESQKGYYSPDEENMNDNPQTETHRKIHNLMIDYII
jgi:flagellar hook-length control protein FliK